MADWTASMEQTFEFYVVDPGTWRDIRRLPNVKSCSITRDSTAETLGSATIDITESVGECYIRVYLITIQNGVREKHPLGTFLVQTPSSSFDGKTRNVSMDAYTPLLELKEDSPPLGYYIPKTIVGTEDPENIMHVAYRLVREHARAPVVEPLLDDPDAIKLDCDFISSPEDTWLTFVTDLTAKAKHTLDLDETGRILFSPKQDTASLQPVWTYTDDNSSILYPDISMDHDLYGIPNVVEVVYTSGTSSRYARVVNDDVNSPTSTVNRGREIIHRVTDPDAVAGDFDSDQYAKQLLKDLSTIEYTITYSHGYCPVRVGDCVRLNYTRAGITNIKAKVVSQTIKCEAGCSVTEKAVFTTKLWEG